jgi:hypothetical protein
MSRSAFRLLFGLTSLFTCVAAMSGCYAGTDPNGSGGGSGAGGPSGTGGGINLGSGGGLNLGSGGGINPGTPNAGAFPSEPIYDGVDPTEVAAFTEDGAFTGTSLCVFEPHLSDAKGAGALYPMNWLRPRFRWAGTGTETVYEIRLRAAGQNSDLKVYTHGTQWLMPQDLWDTIAAGVQNTDITVYVRGLTGSTLNGMSGTFRITPALAGGSMVFWGTESSVVAAGTSQLYGFTVKDEAVVNTLTATQVTSIDRVYTAAGSDLRGELSGEATTIAGFADGAPQCIGCHTATPDGAAMIFTDNYPWNMGVASVAPETLGAQPTWMTAQARQFVKMPFLGTGTMLPAAWATGDRTLITTLGRREDSTVPYFYINYGYPSNGEANSYEPYRHDLVWLDLATTTVVSDTLPVATVTDDPFYSGPERKTAAAERGEELIAAEGSAYGVLITDPAGSISNPAAAKLSLRVAYNVSESSIDGHPDWHNNTSDIKIADLTSPRVGGTGTALAGASDPTLLEYYPAFSPDDAFVAFTRAPAPTNTQRCRQGNFITRTGTEGDPVCDNFGLQLGANPDGPYYNRNGEIFVVPAAGGTPHRLRANDPVMCGGEASPGVLNSWPKWSSKVRVDETTGKQYYFVVFSSARAYPDQFDLTPTEYTPPILNRSSQLYMGVIEHDPATQVTTSYAAIYLWNQNYLSTGGGAYEPLKTANLTPAWEDFTIPAVPPVIVVK